MLEGWLTGHNGTLTLNWAKIKEEAERGPLTNIFGRQPVLPLYLLMSNRAWHLTGN